MKLTLRNLLAYLDNLLEPADAQAMAAKIEETPAVAELVHRIREVTKKVRLAAPAVDAKGLGLDPNTVAEYLNHDLHDDRVPDFEKVCFESDMHLAEVAACHEILSLVLERPAEISQTARQRMYALINAPTPKNAAPAQSAPVAAPIAAPIAAAASATSSASGSSAGDVRPKREVPDYLKQAEPATAKAGRGWAVALIAIAAMLLLAATAALTVLPRESLPESLRPLAEAIYPRVSDLAVSHDVKDDLKPKPVPVPIPSTPPSTQTPDTTGGVPGVPTGPVTSTTATTSTTELRQPSSAVAPAADTVGKPATPGAIPPVPSVDAPPITTTTVPTNTTSSTTVPAPSVPIGPSVSTTPDSTTTPSTVPAAPTTTTTNPPTTTPPENTTPTTPTTTPPATPATTPPVAPTTPAAPATAKIEPVGRVNSDVAHVVLRFNAEKNIWTRIVKGDAIAVGDRLLALPNYRPQLALDNGLTIDLLGGTLVELLPIDASGTPGMALYRGRLMLLTSGGTKSSLRLEIGRSQTVLSLATAELGVEYGARRPAGGDPTQPSPWVAQLYAKSGAIGWSSPGGPETPLTIPSQWFLTETTLPAAATQSSLPAWLTNDERNLLEKDAAKAIEAVLETDKAVSLALREMAGDRRAETVQMALACLAQIGEYDDFVPLLRDPIQRYAACEKYLNILADALSFGPAYAEKVRDAFVRQHGPRGAQVYRMLWGYNDEQLQAGDAKALVELLDHEELDFRVVAYWNLNQVTAVPPPYSPHDAALKRKTTIQKWIQKLDAGQIGRKKAG